MAEIDKLLKRLDELSSKLGDKKSNNFPLWRNLRQAMNEFANYVNFEYLDSTTEAEKTSASEYPKKIERLKKYIKKHPMGNKEKEALLYGN